MNRAPSTNGHSAQALRARGGYDAYFAQTGESALAAPGGGAENIGDAKEFSPLDPVIGGPRDPHGEPGQRTAQGPVAPGASVSPPHAAASANNAAAQATHSLAPENQSAVPSGSTSAAAEARGTFAQPSAARSSAAAEFGPSAQSPAAQAALSRPDATQATSAESVASPSAAQAVARADETAGRGRPADAATPWAPERVDRTAYEPAPRVEVLPAALHSIELLADISAAKRAQLRSSTGVRGALNKVGFKLGLSPAEQRAEDRRGRIRRQLTSTYQIAVVSVKGGVGRTTTAATLGSTFACLRPDRVVAIDANPDFGDLATRTCRHPYGLTLRDLALSQHLDAFSAVQSFTSINSADLAVIASPWTTEASEALSGREYAAAVEVLRRHYNLLLVDCGTGVLDSATATVLQTSDAVVVVTPATVGGVTGAVATLNWLSAHGLQHLIAKSIVAIAHHQPLKPTVDVDAIEKLFETAQRPTCVLPYDAHLAEGGEIDLRLLDKDTLLAFEELAAWLADGFPGYLTGGAERPGDRGGWR